MDLHMDEGQLRLFIQQLEGQQERFCQQIVQRAREELIRIEQQATRYDPICDLGTIFLHLQRIQIMLANEQNERAARGLPASNYLNLDPLAVINGLVSVLNSPAEAGDPNVTQFFEVLNRIMDQVVEVERKQAPPLKRDYKPGDFELPEHVKEVLSAQEIQVIEATIDRFREAFQNGQRQVHGIYFLPYVIADARRGEPSNVLLREQELRQVVESNVQTVDSYKKHALLAAHLRDFMVNREAHREPESELLYHPIGATNKWNDWTREQIKEWIRFFIIDQKSLDLIDSKMFDGQSLNAFVKSEDQWKIDKWPFGVFITVKSHFNRVVNSMNSYEFKAYL